MLYQPTATEITATLNAARAKFKYLGSRLDKAATILADVNTFIDTSRDPWRFVSCAKPTIFGSELAGTLSSEPKNSYLVGCPFGHSACTCPDFEHNNTQIHTDPPGYFCKHILAYHSYRRILTQALNYRITGDYDRRHERRDAELHPGSLCVLRDEKGCRAITYQEGHRFPITVCFIRPGRDLCWLPRTDAEAAALATWLYSAPSFVRALSYDEQMELNDLAERRDDAALRSAFTGNIRSIA